jgi:DNA-damage-inducible protein J
MMSKVVIACQLDFETKKKVSKILRAEGLTITSAVDHFLKKVISSCDIPFDIKQPNLKTIAAINELENR